MGVSPAIAFLGGLVVASIAYGSVLALLGMILWKHATKPVDVPAPAGTPERRRSISSGSTQVNHSGFLQVTKEYEVEVGEFSVRALLKDNKDKGSKPLWARLRNNVLALYEGPHDSDAQFEVVLDGVKVSHFPEDLVESERWLPGYPIRLEHPDRELALGSRVLYLFATTGVDKEDWFLTCVRAAMVHEEAYSRHLRAVAERNRRYVAGLLHLIKLPTMSDEVRWLNAIFGRIFLDVNREGGLTSYFTNKINQKIRRKISRDGKPSFLGDVHVRSLTVGDNLPMMMQATLKHLSGDGSLTVDGYLKYAGGFSVSIEASAIVPGINARVALLLTVLLKNVEGQVQLRIKSPPTECIWLGFHTMPEIDMVIDAEVADKAITWPSVIRLIDKSIRDAVVEFMVLPNMDDYEMPIMRQPTAAAETDDDLGSQSQQIVDFATIETDDDFVEVLTSPDAPTQPATEATGLRQRSPAAPSESR